ncbi:hypothetical protein M0802_007316 [Mischocyttarus mexicanus]|nr:hypothetical protein M0802_007316 [Mischocyttarus mexicanus]
MISILRRSTPRFVKILDNSGVIYRRVAQLLEILGSFRCSKQDQPLCRTDWLNGSQLVDLPLSLPPLPRKFHENPGNTFGET